MDREFRSKKRERERERPMNSESTSKSGTKERDERFPRRREKGEREEGPHAHVYALRDLPRASLTHVRVYANAPHGATRRRPTEYTRHRGKRWNKNKRAKGERRRRTGERTD